MCVSLFLFFQKSSKAIIMLNKNEESSSWMVNFKFLTFVFKRNLTLRHTFIKP